MKRKVYLSLLGVFISLGLTFFSLWHKPFMVYGYYNRKKKKFYKRTRIGSSTTLSDKSNIDISNNVWIGQYCLLDGLGGITIGEGVHIASHSCIYTHSSHNSIRLLGSKYIEVPAGKRPGYIIKKVAIGDYSFIGTSSVILPGVNIGKGCIIGAGSVVSQDIPDFSVAAGSPSRIIGNTRDLDEKLLAQYKCSDTYYLNSILK